MAKSRCITEPGPACPPSSLRVVAVVAAVVTKVASASSVGYDSVIGLCVKVAKTNNWSSNEGEPDLAAIFYGKEIALVISIMALTSTSGIFDISKCTVDSIAIEGCIYRGEGNANLVVALPSDHKVIRIRKSLSSEFTMEDNVRRICRDVDFIRNVISDFFGHFVCVPEISYLDQAEITRLSEKIHTARPENRRFKKITGGYVTKFPDYTFLPEHLSGFSNKSTFCVEIKPKQGFVCKADQKFKKCPYCLTQYYKSRNGETRQLSGYCPFDIFSGQKARMERALEALLRSPQNNMRIFKDGMLVYDERIAGEDILERVLTDWFSNNDPNYCLEAFLRLTRRALVCPFDSNINESELITYETAEELEILCRLDPSLVQKVRTLLDLIDVQECEPMDDSLPHGSALERILQMQKLHRCGLDVVAWIYDKFSTILSDELIHTELMRTGITGASTQCHVTMDCKKEPLKDKEKKQLFDWMNKKSVLESKINITSCLQETNNFSNHKEQTLHSKIINENFLKNIAIDDIQNILKNYLLFCMARDCSILMAFQEVDKELSENIHFKHQIKVSKDQSFLVSIRILDLDMKSLVCIEKHCRRNNDILQAVIEVLEKKLVL